MSNQPDNTSSPLRRAGFEAELIALAPFGLSPWNHRAIVTDDGCLALYWTVDGVDRIRMFTQEETATLLDLLYAGRDEILTHHREGK